jgi:cell division inhibitor SepF
MAGAMRKMAVYLGLVEDEDHYDEYDEAYVEAVPPALSHVHPSQAPVGRNGHGGAAVAPLRTAPMTAPPVVEGYRITTLHPRTYNEARTIGEHYRDGTPVIMNLTEMDDTDAKRLVDFAAGLVFGLRGSIERVTQKVFLLSPNNVEVTAEDKQRIAEGGFFNQS